MQTHPTGGRSPTPRATRSTSPHGATTARGRLDVSGELNEKLAEPPRCFVEPRERSAAADQQSGCPCCDIELVKVRLHIESKLLVVFVNPRLSWARIANLFRSEDRFGGSTDPEAFGFVPDPADRKFAALADAVQVPLVTSDAGLLNAGGQMAVPVLKPSEFARRCGALYRESGLR